MRLLPVSLNIILMAISLCFTTKTLLRETSNKPGAEIPKMVNIPNVDPGSGMVVTCNYACICDSQAKFHVQI